MGCFRKHILNILRGISHSYFKMCLILLIIANLFLFIIFTFITPQISLYTQIFLYLSSRPFQFVTISLGLPLLIFLIENTFKVREKFLDDKRRRQVESITQTHELWNDIANICVKFVYADEWDKDVVISLKSDIESFIIKAEEVSNTIYFEFSNLKEIIGDEKIFTNFFLTPFDLLESCISSVVDRVCVNEKYSDKKMREVQNQIKIIYNGIKVLTHHRTINIMKNSMLLSENSNNELKMDIKKDFDNLKKLNLIFFRQFLDFYKVQDSDDDLMKINYYLDEIKNNKDYNENDFSVGFEKLYNNLTNEKKLSLKEIHQFSDELILQLALILKGKDLMSNFNHYNKMFCKLKMI